MNIIELAKQAYLYSPSVAWTIEKSDTFVATHDGVHAFAALVAAHEREACAKIADVAEPYKCADLIRARSNT